MKEIKEDWQLTPAEIKENYTNNLARQVEAIASLADKLHLHFGHEQEEINELPEDKVQELYKRLSESIQKFSEVKNNLETGNPNLVKNKI
jgi:galactokinase/mevalonate kinase-like predicted kinase